MEIMERNNKRAIVIVYCSRTHDANENENEYYYVIHNNTNTNQMHTSSHHFA